MPGEGVHVSATGRKTFIPLENNPTVFTQLAHDLGVSEELGFYDVYSIDESASLASIPRPALGLIFIAPPATYRAVRAADGIVELTGAPTYGARGAEKPVLWLPQTIGNACGLMALLHAVANGEARSFIRDGSTLDSLLKAIAPLQPVARAAAVYDNEATEQAHLRAARMGSTAAPRAEEHAEHHFLAFVKGGDGHLWELEGSVDGPIDRGLLSEGDDMLSARALDLGVKRFLRQSQGALEFSVVALARRPASED